MTENVAPPSAPNGESTRGIPYYEKLKRDLRDTLTKKRQLDKDMASLEEQIYRFETSYLEETGAGNIIRGFDNYIKGTSTSAGGAGGGGGGGMAGSGTTTRRKGAIVELDRVFSRSSASFMRENSPQSSTPPTPSHAPTPTSANPTSARESSNHPTPTSATSLKGGANNIAGLGGAAGGGGSGSGGGGSGPGPKKGRKQAEKEDEEGEGKQPKRLKITYARGATGAGQGAGIAAGPGAEVGAGAGGD